MLRPVSARGPLIVAVIVGLLGLAPVAAQTKASDVSQKASETVDAIKSYSVEKKDEAVAYARKVGAEVDAHIKELKAEAARQTGEAKARSDALLRDLDAKRAQAGRKASEMSRATQSSWDRAKEAFANAYREVAAAYDRAAAEIQK